MKRATSAKIQTGKLGEDIAVDYLKNEGYRIIERNYRCVFGEIDIVATDRNVIVFVEVRSRRSDRYGYPQESVGLNKKMKVSKIALNYLKEKQFQDCRARFDVVAVKILPEGSEVKLIKNAFDLMY